MATMRPETILLPPRINPMFIIGGNGGSLVNGNDIGDGKHFYCAKCMSVVACACIRPCFSMCDHDFCSSCVAMKLPQNVAHVKCTGESSTVSEKDRGVTILRPETVQLPSCIDPISITDGNEGSPVNDISDSKRFYCAKCMHVVPCACMRYNFTTCDHDFCSRCVAMKLRQNVARVKCTGESSTASEEYRGVTMLRPETVQLPSRINPMFITDGNEGSPVNDISDSKRFYCAKCMHVVPCACTRYNFTMCDHDFCSRCVAMKLHQNVARVKCTGESSTVSEEYRGVTMLQPEMVLVSWRIAPLSITDGNEDSPVDDITDGKRFFCAKCMHVVPCACIRSNFTNCDHDFCSRCVGLKLCQNVPLVKCTVDNSTVAERYHSMAMVRPETVSSRIGPKFVTGGNEDSPLVDSNDIGDGKNIAHVGYSEGGEGDDDLFYCNICMEMVARTLKFSVNSCGHVFCSSCITQYVAAKLDNNVARVECPDPGCKGGVVELERCHEIIPPDLLDKWGFLLCESALGTKRIYCPYRECSAPLVADSEAGTAAVTEAECPHCHRLFCVRCAVPWHGGITCTEFQKLGLDERGPEDILLRRLVGREGWQRCPKCQMYVEKSEGCNYIKCRCGYSFCYRCASKLSALNHFCNKCKR
ncbi:hypothetical protein ACQJBY_012663 [Aegilops geniculata]